MTSYVLSPTVALLTEHLEHSPITLIDEIINSINTLVTNSLDTHEIRNGIHQLETLLGNLVDKNFDKFEIYVLRNLLTVPENLVGWVRLPHHKGLDFTTLTPSSIDHPQPPSTETFSRLREQLIASHYLNQTLKTELACNAVLISRLKSALSLTEPSLQTSTTPQPNNEPLSIVTSNTPASLHPLDTTAQFISLQLPTLRSLLSTIEPKLQHLRELQDSVPLDASPSPPPSPTAIKDLSDLDPNNPNISPDERRKRYIEKMVRRHMQKQRRLKLTNRGEVVGGEYWDGAASKVGAAAGATERRRGLGEVVMLEGVFGLRQPEKGCAEGEES
ncbi:Mis12 protein-domain-containing protein [Kalaharituber pfeilii]|nr:Mis12 protein-domain-containing protein [Kalaharituber pfeilii]